MISALTSYFAASFKKMRILFDWNDQLMEAAIRGDIEKMSLALENGADINFANEAGVTPLIYACANQHSFAAIFLLGRGADHAIRTNEGWRAYDFAKNQGLEVAQRLLQLHGGKPPMYDYREQTLKTFDDKRLDVYRRMFDAETMARKPFFNIGAGHTYHPMWQNVDHISDYYASVLFNNIDVDWDIEQKIPLPFKEGTMLAVYSSHTIEHITDDQARHVFRESFRVLQRDGWIRVTCPDIQIYYDAYRKKDASFELYQPMRDNGLSWEICFVNEFATQLRDLRDKKELADEIDRIFSTMALDQGCNHFTAQIDYNIQRTMVGSHINWWSFEKIAAFLTEAGFTDIQRSSRGGSAYPPMRDTLYFDSTDIESSVWVEARKTGA